MSDFMKQVTEYQLKHRCKKSEAIYAVQQAHPEMYEAWLASVNRKDGAPQSSILSPQPAATKTVPGGVREYLTMVKACQAFHGCTLEASHIAVSRICPTGHQAWVNRIHSLPA
jgi:hypothetical protein